MNLRIISLAIAFVTLSCGNNKQQSVIDKENLSGYWEINSVMLPDGTEKHFDTNLIVDYLEVVGDFGSRMKVSPQLDGSFQTNGVIEDFEIKFENDSLNMYYKTPYAKWKETVLEADGEVLKVINHEKNIYSYTRYSN